MANIGKIALYFMFVRDQLKIYHWQTKNYARHKSSDDLVEKLSEKMDKFIEVMQGIENTRLSIKHDNFPVLHNQTDNSIVKILNLFKEWLSKELPVYIKNNTDLLNIRDDILSDVNNTLYLFTFS